MLHLIASLHASDNHSADVFAGLARTAERGLLDAVFLDDRLALPEPGGAEGVNGGAVGAVGAISAVGAANGGTFSAVDLGSGGTAGPVGPVGTVNAAAAPDGGGLEPLTLLSAIATVTSQVGLIASVSTTFSEPYPLARSLASLDHISRGRAGWAIGIDGGLEEASNFNMDEPVDAAVRYERAAELLDVVTQLWDSWADDPAGRRARVREIEHTGLFFKVRGPLNVRRTPQGWPLLVHQATSSGDDMEFAARYAEVVFSAQRDVASAAVFAREVKARAAAYGREPYVPLILPELSTLVASDGGPVVHRAKRIADVMQHWVEGGAADGFTVRPAGLPGGFRVFVDQVVPELQRRGLFRSSYDGGTLRDRFGLPRPEDHFPLFETQPLPQPSVAWPALAPV